MSGAGWYADPLQRAELRWYDGSAWGEHVRSGTTTGTDTLDVQGVPLAAGPAWDVADVLPTPPAPGPESRTSPRGPGRATILTITGVILAFVVLAVVGLVALLVLVRNSGALTTTDIEQQIGSSLGEQRESTVTVHCPPVIYLGESGGTIQCSASDDLTGAQLRIQVTIKRAKVTDWRVLDTAGPQGLPGAPGRLPAVAGVPYRLG